MMQSIRDLVADDGYAITFQTMGQYRTALLKAIDAAGASARPEDCKCRRLGAWNGEHHPLCDATPAIPAPSASRAVYEASHHNAVCIDGECQGCIASPAPAQGAQEVQAVDLELYRMAYGSTAPTDAAMDVLAERQRQIRAEGWTPEHDDDHCSGHLSRAAGCYALYGAGIHPPGKPPAQWPWAREWWKPSAERRRNLVKAGALILAEIERIDRLAHRNGGEAHS